MAGWLKGIEEAMFRSAPDGGFIFMSPHPWLFARPRYYRVNDAQKAMIGAIMRKRAALALWLMPAAFVLIAAFFGLAVYGALPRFSPILVGISFGVLVFLPMLIIPHIYLIRKLAPIVSNLPRSEQRFTMGQQFGGMAKAMPKWMLYIGVAGGIMMIVGAGMGLFDIYAEGRAASRYISPLITMASGMMFLAYFAYLAGLKKKAANAS